jgi:subtilisin family serine protease
VHTQGRGGLGTLVVFAAGNDDRPLGADELEALPGVINVGAVNNFGELAQFSNSGPSLDVVAPVGTSTTDISGPDGSDPGDYTTSFGGTSSACPLVAGIAGLLVSAAPMATATEIENALTSTAKQSLFATPDANGHDNFYGYGLVQAQAALRVFVPEKPPVVPSHGCAMTPHGAPASVLLLFALAAILGTIGAVRSRKGD